MGLDITAYSRLDYIGHAGHEDSGTCPAGEDGCYEEHIHAFAYSDFAHALEGIPGKPDIRSEAFGSAAFIDAGYFQRTTATEEHRFAAGSCSGYNRWREHLGTCFDWKRDAEDPFFELIYFADNEGTILWKPARELLKDFEEGRERWRDYCVSNFSDADPFSGKYYLEKYEDWAHAFKLAADGGLVDFH